MNVAFKNFLSALFRTSRRNQRSRRATARLAVGPPEAPRAPATIHVTSHGDNNLRDSSITLREAILIANGDLPLSQLNSYERGIAQIVVPVARDVNRGG